MERKLKILMVSITKCREWGDEYPRILSETVESLLPGAEIIQQFDEHDRATVSYTVHHDSFPVVKDGVRLERIVLETPKKQKQAKTLLHYPH
jgi:hypothetical protein